MASNPGNIEGLTKGDQKSSPASMGSNAPATDADGRPTSTQAGGGVPLTSTTQSKEVGEYSPVIAKHIKSIYEAELKEHGFKSKEDIQKYWGHAQGGEVQIPEEYKDGQPLSFQEYGHMLQTANALAELGPETQDFDRTLSNYFISSSHNTYLTGHQLYGVASTDGYKNVLLRGCRCVEIDVWNGQEEGESSSSSSDSEPGSTKQKWKERLGIEKHVEKLKRKTSRRRSKKLVMPETPTDEQKDPLNETQRVRSNSSRMEPVVLHGHTATKEVPFREVCYTIGKYAFMSSPLPVIVSLEVHTNLEQQKMMVDIMKEEWGDALFELANADEDVPLPTPHSLLRKILIKVKYSPPKQQSNDPSKPSGGASTPGTAQTVSSSSDEEQAAQTQKQAQNVEGKNAGEKPAPSKICEALSSLGVYTRSFHFRDFSQPGNPSQANVNGREVEDSC